MPVKAPSHRHRMPSGRCRATSFGISSPPRPVRPARAFPTGGPQGPRGARFCGPPAQAGVCCPMAARRFGFVPAEKSKNGEGLVRGTGVGR